MLRGKKTDLIWKIKQKKVEKYLTLGLTNLREAKQARNLKKKKKAGNKPHFEACTT